MMIRFSCIAFCALSLLSCTLIGNGKSSKSVLFGTACRSQDFLKKNGFLDESPGLNRDDIFLELWDRQEYSQNGKFDWDAMFKERHGSFSGRLYGVQAGIDGSTVFYRMENGFRCVFVDSSLKVDPHLNESICRPKPSIIKRIKLSALEC